MAADSDGDPIAGSANSVTCWPHKIDKFKRDGKMQVTGTCDDENDLIQTVFTCHGNLHDPDFPQRFSDMLDQLSSMLLTGKDVLMERVKKVEPWNSVRVTLNIPREAATRLRALAAAGDAALQALGILSVQLEGDQVISLRVASQFGGEPQEIVLRTNGSPDSTVVSSASTTSTLPTGPVSALLQAVPGPSGSSSNGFRSPNVVAPATSAVIPPSPKPHSGPSPFPFTSMTHAAQTQQSRQESPHHNFAAPPPYATKSFTPPIQRPVQSVHAPNTNAAAKINPAVDTTVSLASPLLVNLLQTEGKDAEPRPRAPAPSTTVRPRVTSSIKPVTPRMAAPRFMASAPRLPTAPPVATPTPIAPQPPPRPSFIPIQTPPQPPPPPRIMGYSQFTASSSKPCSSNEVKEATTERKSSDGRKLIINPLTGELEPVSSESSESDEDGRSNECFPMSSSTSRASDEDSMDVWQMGRRGDTSDQSDSETSKSNGAEPVVRRRIGAGLHKPATASSTAPVHSHHAPEKIKLRFMMDKPEPGAAPANAYKVDLSFSPAVRKAVPYTGNNRSIGSTAVSGVAAVNSNSSAPPPSPSPGGLAGEEPRVPPLHISLRGRNATVVSNKKKPSNWLLDGDGIYSKMKKKIKLGSGSGKESRDSIAITNCDLTQKPKRAKMKKHLGTSDGESLKVKIPVMPDLDVTELCDEKLSKKRKDSKKVKNNMRHSDSDGDTKVSLKMDSEEWISRTLKEETLRHSVAIPDEVESDVPVSESGVVSGAGQPNERPRVPSIEEPEDSSPVSEPSRTSALKPGNLELSELLRCKKLENSNKKLDCLKIKNKLFAESVQSDENEEASEETASVKKPQEIGGKIKSELSSKIDRVSGKLKNDLSKDGISKKKLDDTINKSIKGNVRTKSGKKDAPLIRLVGSVSMDGDADDTAFNRAKRRHSGDQSSPESQAQKVKRSSSSDQPSPISKPLPNRRFDTLTRKIRKDYAIDRLRKDKVGKVLPLSAKLNAVGDLSSKKAHSSRIANNNGAVKNVDMPASVHTLTVLPALVDVKPAALMRLENDPDKLKDTSGVEGNTQGEDSGIESMDALSEKSPNQGESPCRKDDGGKEMEDGKKGQNHDRTEEEDERKELPDNSCLTRGNSNQETHPPQAHEVPFECSSQNNNSAEPEQDTSTKIEPANDGLLDSFEIKIREAFRRDEDPSREGLAAKILEGSSKDWAKKSTIQTEKESDELENSKDGKDRDENHSRDAESGKEWTKESSPSLEDLERFRVNPPLYTYAKREDSLSPSPTTVEGCDERNHLKEMDNVSLNESNEPSREDGIEDSIANSSVTGRVLRNKSLLEQLLIEIPEDTRRTRSWNKLGNSPGDTPKSSPRPSSPNSNIARPSPRSASKQSPTPRASKRPSKRKCSENAAELIKACMGVEEVKGAAKTTSPGPWKKGELESSDDEPLSDLARNREGSAEQDIKPNILKTNQKIKQIVDDENRNNNKVGVKVITEPPTRRSVRQTQGSIGKSVKSIAVADVRNVRSTRSALCQETCESGNKRRRTSRDGK